jgi:hypothetical protein
MFTKSRLMTVGLTVAVLAVLNRYEPAKNAINGDDKFLGIF